MKKSTLLLLTLFISLSSQALILTPYVGLSITKGDLGKGYVGSGSNYVVGLRLDHEFLHRIQLGIGFDVQNLRFKTDQPSLPGYNYTFYVGSPAFSGYLHAGYRIRINKFSIIPGLIAGAAYAQKKNTEELFKVTYPNGKGYFVGGSLALEYGFKRLAIHLETMPRYYHFKYNTKYNNSLDLHNLPFSLGVAIKL
jgi:hypothetical protein